MNVIESREVKIILEATKDILNVLYLRLAKLNDTYLIREQIDNAIFHLEEAKDKIED